MLVLAVALAGAAAYRMMKWAEAPVATEAEHPASKIVVIPEGSTFQHVAGLLERERLVKSRSAFVLLGKALEADRKIRPGEYELNPAMAPAEAADKPVSYWKQVRPVFQANCQGCHQPAKAKGGYVMTDFARLLAGGESGHKAVIASQPDASALIASMLKRRSLRSFSKSI